MAFVTAKVRRKTMKCTIKCKLTYSRLIRFVRFCESRGMMEMLLREKELELKKEQLEKNEQKQDAMMKMMAQQQQQQQQ